MKKPIKKPMKLYKKITGEKIFLVICAIYTIVMWLSLVFNFYAFVIELKIAVLIALAFFLINWLFIK